MSVTEAVRVFVEKELAASVRKGELTGGTNLIECGIIDSMGVMKLIAFVEERFSVTISPDDLMPENFETFDAIGTLLGRYIKN